VDGVHLKRAIYCTCIQRFAAVRFSSQHQSEAMAKENAGISVLLHGVHEAKASPGRLATATLTTN
jgi:hypothetical protein